MTDDLANHWGTVLHPDGAGRIRRGSSTHTDLKMAVDRECRPYVLRKVFGSGSDANLWAVMMASKSDPGACLVACGSYVSGDHSPFQDWSTSSFSVLNALSLIETDTERISMAARESVVPLPYYVPCGRPDCCDGDRESLTTLEEECLKEIHIRCLIAVVEKRPIRALLLELMLAGCGAQLREPFLTRLGLLARHHGMWFVVDEIMTAGRTGKVLMTKSKPEEFQKRVSHVTLGKWMGVGLVLVSESFGEVEQESTPASRTGRGPSTFISVSRPLYQWDSVVGNLHMTGARREATLNAISCREEDCWGEGTLVFAPKYRKDLNQGLKSRYLPMLSTTPIDKVPTSNVDWNKEMICGLVRKGVKTWLTLSRANGDCHVRVACDFLVDNAALVQNSNITNMTEVLMKEKADEGLSAPDIKRALCRAADMNLLIKTVKGKKRKKGYIVSGRVSFR